MFHTVSVNVGGLSSRLTRGGLDIPEETPLSWRGPLRCGIVFCTVSCILFVIGIFLTWLGGYESLGESAPITGPILLSVGLLMVILALRQFYIVHRRKQTEKLTREQIPLQNDSLTKKKDEADIQIDDETLATKESLLKEESCMELEPDNEVVIDRQELNHIENVPRLQEPIIIVSPHVDSATITTYSDPALGRAMSPTLMARTQIGTFSGNAQVPVIFPGNSQTVGVIPGITLTGNGSYSPDNSRPTSPIAQTTYNQVGPVVSSRIHPGISLLSGKEEFSVPI